MIHPSFRFKNLYRFVSTDLLYTCKTYDTTNPFILFLTFKQKGKRPKLPEELEKLASETEEEESANKLREELDLTESDLDTMRFLIDVFHCCTMESPSDRLSAEDLHEMILSWTKSNSPTGTFTSSQSSQAFEA